MTCVDIVSTGVANTASVRAAFDRIGCETRFVEQAAQIRNSQLLVLPGVGAFGAAMDQLRGRDWSEPLRQRVIDRRPTLAICLGMQLLGAGSSEAPDDVGLGCVPASAERFDVDVRVPHMGWGRVEAAAGCEILTTGVAYFAHSFRWSAATGGWAAAKATNGASFVAAVECGPVVACQFHPELSGDYGADLLCRWLAAGGTSW